MSLNIITKQRIWLAGLLPALFLYSCGDKPAEHVKNIPGDADMVFAINIGEIKSKTTDLDKVFEFLSGDLDEDTKKIMESGVDLSGIAYAFVDVNTEAGKNTENYIAAIFQLSDPGKFANTMKEEGYGIEEGATSYAVKDDEPHVLLGWNEALAVLYIKEGATTDEIKPLLDGVLAGGAENALYNTNANFKEVIAKKADLNIWADYGNLMESAEEGMNSPEIEELTNIVDLSDSYYGVQVNFEKGEIVADAEFYGNDSYNEKFGNIVKDGTDSGVLSEVPGAESIGLLSLALNVDAVVTLVDALGAKEQLNGALMMAGMKAEDLPKTLNGDIILSVLRMEEPANMMPDGDLALVIGLNDKTKIENLLTQATGMGAVQEEDDHYVVAAAPVPVHLYLKDNALIAVGFQEFAQKYKDGSAGNLGGEGKEVSAKSGIGLFLDFSKLPEFIKEEMDKDGGAAIKEMQSFKLTMNKGGNGAKMNAVVKLNNSEENSIIVLSKMAKEMDGAM